MMGGGGWMGKARDMPGRYEVVRLAQGGGGWGGLGGLRRLRRLRRGRFE